jgi:glycosyltransferase involved in cell wall biosynthesis
LNSPDAVKVSVIVPAYRAGATLARSVGALLAQRFSGSMEVIVVASGDDEAQLPVLPRSPGLRVQTHTPRLPAAAARNLGARIARGDALAFTDADVIVSDRWLQCLWEASEGRWGVAGAIANGTPANVAGTVEYLVEFFDLSPGRDAPSEHGATANLFLPRQLWDAYGPFPDGMEGCEDTWLTSRLHADGRLRFCSPALVHHLNRQRLGAVLGHQYRLGTSHARLAVRQGCAPRHPIAHSAMVTTGRIRYLYRMLRRWTPGDLRRARRLGPLVVAGFGAWGAGLATEAVRCKRKSNHRAGLQP